MSEEQQIYERAIKAAKEIMGVYDIAVPRGRGTPKNGIERTIAIIISENMLGRHRDA